MWQLPLELFEQGIEGVDESYHNLSHHGMDEEKLAQLALVEQGVINEWAGFLRKLKADKMLNETMVLLTSNLGSEFLAQLPEGVRL